MTPPLSYVYPQRIRKVFETTRGYSLISINTNDFMATMFMISLVGAISIYVLLPRVFQMGAPLTALSSIGVFVICHIVFYSWLMLSGESKSSFVESILPDALKLMASNLRSGSTVDRALIQSAREEFGPLKEAIEMAGKRIATGDDEETAFRGMTEKINSDNLARAVDLIIQGIRSGGQLANILDNIADVFRERSLLDKEMRSGILMYAIFIFFVLGFGAPVLFGISDYLVTISTRDIGGMAQMNEEVVLVGSPVPVSTRGTSINPDFMTLFFIIALTISSLTGSIVLGQILRGRVKAGIKFIPVLVTLSIVLFFLIKYVLNATLGQILV